MHLQPCPEPSVRLDPAPLTMLCAASGGADPSRPLADEWAGFWGADDRYYLRRSLAAGTEWLVGTLDDAGDAPRPADVVGVITQPAGPPAALAPAAAPGRGATRLMLVGRQPAGGRMRMAVPACGRRVRHA